MSEATRRRIRRSAEEWRGLIEEQTSSGQTQGAFCMARGLGEASFQNWKRRLAAAEPPQGEAWLELGTLAEREASGWDIELALGNGICLRLRRC